MDKLFDQLVASHPALAGGPFTWKAAQHGPLATDIRAALKTAYDQGFEDGVGKPEEAPKPAGKKK